MRGRRTTKAQLLQRAEARTALWTIIDSTPEPYPALLRAYILDPRNADPHDSKAFFGARADLMALICAAAEVQASVTSHYVRANCPLCQPPYVHPYANHTVPGGIERHLRGTHNNRHCEVTKAAFELARDSDIERPMMEPVGPPQKGAARPANGELVPDGQDALWEIDTVDEIDSPYRHALPVPSLVRWVYCNREEAERVRERWVSALRWRVIDANTRMWVSSHLRSGYIPTLNDPNETDLVPPKRDIVKWVWEAPEPVFVDERGAIDQCLMVAMRDAIATLSIGRET